MWRKSWLFLVFGLLLLASPAPAQDALLGLADSLLHTPRADLAADLYRLVIQRFPDSYWADRAQVGLLRYQLRGSAEHQALANLENLLNSPRLALLAPPLLSLLTEDTTFPLPWYRLLLARRVPQLPHRTEILSDFAQRSDSLGLWALKTLAADLKDRRRNAQIGIARHLLAQHPATARLLLRRYPEDPEARRLQVQMALPKDTLQALDLLRAPTSPVLRQQKATLLLALGDAEGALQTLKDDPDTLAPIAHLKALGWLAIGLQARLEDLIPHLQDPWVRARILLTLHRPEEALAVLDSALARGTPPNSSALQGVYARFFLTPHSLRIQALMDLGRYAEAAVAFLHHPTWRSQGYALAQALDSTGMPALAQRVLRVALPLPPGPTFVPREHLLELQARGLVTPGLLDTFKLLGLRPPHSPNDSLRESVLLAMARGLPLLEGARQLLEAQDPWTVIRLLSDLKLNAEGYRLLAEAYILAYELTGNDTYARQADALFQAQQVHAPDLYLRLHRRYQPQALLNADTLKVPRGEVAYLVEGLLNAGNPELAWRIARRSHLRDRSLRFRLFLAVQQLDSAYAVLDFQRPGDVLALAQQLAQQGAEELALDLLKRVTWTGFEVGRRAARLRVRLAYALERWPDLASEARAYLQHYGSNDTVQLRLAQALLATGASTQAALRALPLKNPEARAVLGQALWQSGHGDWARSFADVVPEITFHKLLDQGDVLTLLTLPIPQDSALLHRYLVLLATTGHEDFAQKLADSVAAVGLLSASTARLALVEAQVQQGKVNAALQALKHLSHPDARARAWYALGLFWMRHQDFARAKEAFFKVIQWGGPETRGRGAFKLATVLFQERRYREAVEYYRMAAELVQTDPQLVAEAYHNTAVCLKRLKDLEGARQAYLTLIQRFPEREEALDARISLALVDMELQKLQEGREHLAFAEGLMPEFAQEAEVLYWLGVLARMQGRWAQALGLFERVYTFHSDHAQWAPLARYEAALLLEQTGQTSRARTLFQQLLQSLKPDDPLYPEVQKHLQP